ncbi:MAG: GDP-mannose 4,6-dehydratase [Acidobacteriia bacterium]|nr:GDP-mannose 4,6-dehydratase [Terriglobia bacterium]
MRILVTGGAGFIGSHVAETLLRQGHAVAILDELNDYYEPALKRSNLECIGQVGRFEFHQGSLCEPDSVRRFMGRFLPEAVVHLAARAGVRPSLSQPLLYEQVNVQGTIALLEVCRELGIGRFVFASSSSVYGIANQVPFREDDPRLRPISPYAATKLAGEHFCQVYAHLYGISAVCLRFFTVYGPRQRPDLAIRKFTAMIDAGEAIPVFGDGSSGRDYTFVDDIVQGILASLTFPCQFEVFNLGNSHPVTLIDLIAEIEQALGKQARLSHLPEQPGDVPITFADISKARRLLGYDPRTPFTEGIRKFVNWHHLQKELTVRA